MEGLSNRDTLSDSKLLLIFPCQWPLGEEMAEEAELQEDKAMAWLQAVSESEEGQQL